LLFTCIKRLDFEDPRTATSMDRKIETWDRATSGFGNSSVPTSAMSRDVWDAIRGRWRNRAVTVWIIHLVCTRRRRRLHAVQSPCKCPSFYSSTAKNEEDKNHSSCKHQRCPHADLLHAEPHRFEISEERR